MKKITGMLICICCIVTTLGVVFFASGCDVVRKLQGAELEFPKKVAAADSLSFDIALNYQDNDGESTDINISCYKKGSEYAYDYRLADSRLGSAYRNLYADECLYEVYTNALNTGSYYVKEDVAVDDQTNFLYMVCQNITALSVAALVFTSHKETLNGETVYRYDLSAEEGDFKFWFNDKEMVKLLAVFKSTDGEGNETQEKYTLSFSNYKFEQVDTAPFTRPADLDGLYIESPISFEDWVSIIGNFGKKVSTVSAVKK